MPLYRDVAFSFLVSYMKWSLFYTKYKKTLNNNENSNSNNNNNAILG